MIQKLFFVFVLTLTFFGTVTLTLAQSQTPTPTSNSQIKCDPNHKQIGGVVTGTIGTFGFEDVYCVTEDLKVPSGQTFEIKAGTWLVFHPGQKMVVRGQLLADGNTVFPVHFMSADKEGWEGIHFQVSARNSWCTGCNVENIRPGGVGIQIDAPVSILTSLIRGVPGGTAISATVPFTLSHTRIDYVDTGVYLSSQPPQTQTISFMSIIRCLKGVVNRGQLLKLDNSIFASCDVGVSTALSGTTTVSYTLFHEYNQKFITERNSQLIQGPGIFEAEPGFTNFPDNLTLRADSPAVNAADPQVDYHREPGYNGGRADLGAYGNTWRAPQRPPKVDPTDFTASVDKLVLTGQPGETVTFTLRITNNSSVLEDFALGAYVNYGREFPIRGISRGRHDSYPSRFFEIEPNEQYQLNIEVQIPAYATNGMVHIIEPYIRGQLSDFSAEFQLTTIVSAPTNIEYISHIGIAPQDVFVEGNYAYIAAGKDGLRIWDISESSVPQEIGMYSPDNPFWFAHKIIVKGQYAYIAAGQAGLRIIDISNPTQPSEVGSYDIIGSAEDVKIVQNYAYMVWRICHYPHCTAKLHIIDISDPTIPTEVNIYDRRQLEDITIIDHFAYLVGGSYASPGGMYILDIANPALPIEISTYELKDSGGARSLVVYNGYAYLLLNNGRGMIVDVSNPANLIEIGEWRPPANISKITLVDHYLYPLGYMPPTQIIDISKPTKPVEVVGNFDVLDNVKNITTINGRGYLAAGTSGLKIVDISNPSTPKDMEALGTPSFAQAVTVVNNYAYVADADNGLRIFDVSEPITPTQVGFYDKLGGAWNVAIKDNYAYVTFSNCPVNTRNREYYNCDTAVHVLNISNPALPTEVEKYEDWKELQITGDYAYVLDEKKLLHVFDISNPVKPQEINSFNEPVADFTLANSYLYLLPPNNFQFAVGQNSYTHDSYLKILNPISLTEVSSLNLPSPATKITVANDYAYIYWIVPYATIHVDGWLSVNISNPTVPTLEHDVYTPLNVRAIMADSHYSYLAADTYGLRILDISNPTYPKEVDAFGAGKVAMDVAISDGYIYLANGYNGLYILRHSGH